MMGKVTHRTAGLIFLSHFLLIAKRVISQSKMSVRIYVVMFFLIGLGLLNKLANEMLSASEDVLSDPMLARLVFISLPWLIPVISMFRFPVTFQSQTEFVRSRFYFLFITDRLDLYHSVVLRFAFNAIPGFLITFFLLMKLSAQVAVPVSVITAGITGSLFMICITSLIQTLMYWLRYAAAGYAGKKFILCNRLTLIAVIMIGEVLIIGVLAMIPTATIVFLRKYLSQVIPEPVFNGLMFIMITFYLFFIARLLNKIISVRFDAGYKMFLKGIQSLETVKVSSGSGGNRWNFYYRSLLYLVYRFFQDRIPVTAEFFMKSVFKSSARRPQLISPIVFFAAGIIIFSFTRPDIQLMTVPVLTVVCFMSVVSAFQPACTTVIGMVDQLGHSFKKPVTGLMNAWLIVFVPVMFFATMASFFTDLDTGVVILSLFIGIIFNSPYIILCCLYPSSVMVPQMLMIMLSGVLMYLFMIGQVFFMSAGYVFLLVMAWKQYRRAWIEKNLG